MQPPPQQMSEASEKVIKLQVQQQAQRRRILQSQASIRTKNYKVAQFTSQDPEGKIQISLSRPSASPRIKIVNINLKKSGQNSNGLSLNTRHKKSKMLEKIKMEQMRRETQQKLNKSRSVTKNTEQVHFV